MGVVVRKVSAALPIALDRDWGCSADGAVCCTNASSSSAQGCSVETALEAASLHPAQLLGIEDRKGTLNYDSDAGTVMGMVGGRASACCSKAGLLQMQAASAASLGVLGSLALPRICSGLLSGDFFPVGAGDAS